MSFFLLFMKLASIPATRRGKHEWVAAASKSDKQKQTPPFSRDTRLEDGVQQA